MGDDDVEKVVEELLDRASSSYDCVEQEVDDDVKEAVDALLDQTTIWDDPSKIELDFYSLDYRRVPSIASASSNAGDSEFGDLSEGELPVLASDEDSDTEFQKLQHFTYKTRNSTFKREHSVGIPSQKMPKLECQVDTSDLYHEYDDLPPLERLTIHCEESVPLEVVGRVTSVVDCLVVVQSENGVALDFDSVLFDEDRKSIGVVFDLSDPSKNHCIRYDSIQKKRLLR
ncbi:hypothetical protein KIN20_032606 [Parelaphostrongylus tenuis]|uniref:H/ACA ribonucleoprotein complex subunit n=1 Tax=Parelaphostrongylus tenuis TaxID=148309 RepID=A0AAD5R7G0_PARTN|nr:hypothetical protein KIN20_032606 [Parelaphostrongylus tenuis]